MIIPIKVNGINLVDSMIIELHGDFKTCMKSNEDYVVGSLFENKKKERYLIIGNHILEGKETLLEKPMVKLKKLKHINYTNYVINSIITKKYVFRTRPKPIVLNVPKEN